MRSYNINPDGSGDGAWSDFINRSLKRGTEQQFFGTASIKVQQTTRGTRFYAKIPPGKASSGGGLKLRGEWDPTEVYNLNDMVVISMGLNQGTYVALQSISVVAPYTGGQYWMQLPGGLLGQWM